MAEIDEAHFSSLENRVAKIEECIKHKKETEEQQWKTSLDRKLEDIGDKVKAVGNRLQQEQKTTESQWIFNVSLTAIIFAGGLAATDTIISTITEIARSYNLPAIILFSVGVVGLLFASRRIRIKPTKD